MAEMLRKRRRSLYMSLRDLAEKSGVAYGTIWRIEQGNFKRVQPRTARALSQALGVQPEQIAEFVEADRGEQSLQATNSTLPGVAPPTEAPESEDADDTAAIEIPVYDLADLLAEMRPETFHNETDWGKPVGAEVW